MRLIAISSISSGEKTIGFRILDTDTKQVLNVPVISVLNAIKVRGIQIINLTTRGGLLYTTENLPVISNGNLINNDAVIIIENDRNDSYTITNHTGDISTINGVELKRLVAIRGLVSSTYKICKNIADTQILKVIGPRNKYKGGYINTTSRSNNWSKGLSPFFLPCDIAKNVENAWQFSKVYEEHTDIEGNPNERYFDWAQNGFNTAKASRYPMGKGRKPLYSYWNGEKLSYIEARKKIYIPLYARAVVGTEAYEYLKSIYLKGQNIVLWDFDGYDHKNFGMTLDNVIHSTTKKMGHAFVLLMLLKGKIEVSGDNVIIHDTLE